MTLGRAVLELVTDSTKFTKGMGDAEGAARKLGPIAVGAFTLAATGVVALGAAALKLGSDFDEASDRIRIGTGATGTALAGLNNDFKAVFSTVPVSMKDASTAIAELNTRTGLTGPALQGLATQLLNLSRITGTDLSANVAAATRLFGDWSIASGDQAGALDRIFIASQQTGIGVDTLMERVVTFGAPLRQMGFSLDESAALLGKWEKEGVNSEAILGALKIGVANFAKENKDAKTGLAEFIEKVKELGPGAEATSLAVATFGSRAGPDMAAAVLEGRFAIEDYEKAIASSGETINGAAADTDDWSQRLDVMKNKLLVAVAPAAEKVFNGLGRLIEWVTPYVEQIAMWIGENLPGAMDAAGSALQELQPLFSLLGDVLGWLFQNVLPAVGAGFGIVFGTIHNVISAVQTLVGWLRDAWSWANNAVSAARNLPVVGGLLQAVGFAEGTDHITNGPEVFVAGERGRERVTVQPLRGGSTGSAVGGDGHGHPIVLDGRVVGGLLGRRTVRGAAFAGGSIG